MGVGGSVWVGWLIDVLNVHTVHSFSFYSTLHLSLPSPLFLSTTRAKRYTRIVCSAPSSLPPFVHALAAYNTIPTLPRYPHLLVSSAGSRKKGGGGLF